MMADPRPLNEGNFRAVAGMQLVYEPSAKCDRAVKKHPCRDCHSCQFCSDARCHSCRGNKGSPGEVLSRKLSLCEQIQVYEAINARDGRQREGISNK